MASEGKMKRHFMYPSLGSTRALLARSLGIFRSFKRKVSRRNVKQEMEPLAANEVNFSTSGNYGATHYEFAVPNQEAQSDDEDQLSDHGDERLESNKSPLSQSNSNTESNKASVCSTMPRPADLPLPVDDTDFNDESAFHPDTSLHSKEKRQNQPTLRISATSQSPVLGSPDSDKDILGYLDHTPDIHRDAVDGVGSLSYSSVYHTSKFSEVMPGVFVPQHPVQLQISKVQTVHSHIQIFSSYMLVINLEHGDQKWTVQKKLRQVASLHSGLLLFRTRLKMPAATRVARQQRQSMRKQIKQAQQAVDTVDGENGAANKRLLKYPRRALQTMDATVRAELETYLRNLFHHPLFRSHQAVLEFFEISPVSFISELGTKVKEGYVKKRIGDSSPNNCCKCMVAPCSGRYRHRWLVLKETCLFFLAPNTGQVRTVMLMDAGFQVSHGYRLIGARNGLLISNLSRSLKIKCDSEFSKKEWYSVITKTQHKYAKDFTSQDTRYGSFAPVRSNSYARWYVDGARYMWDVADMLEGAKEEIFITDWWMSPQIYLKRPDLTGHQWRLAEVLRRKAESGVRIFILLYKEVELALGISSLLTKQTVNQLHPNIKVLRHPDHIGVLYWAHHEKLVIIDQMYAFVSGIDMAFGRWDDYRHKLVDVGHAGVQVSAHQGIQKGALQHLVRGANEVLVNTVTLSAPSSRRTSRESSVFEDITGSKTGTPVFLNQCEPESCRRLDQDHHRDICENPPVVPGPGEDIIDRSNTIRTEVPMGETESKDPKNTVNNGKSVQVSSVVETIPLHSVTKKLNVKTRFFKRESELPKDATSSNELSSDEDHRDRRMGKSFKEVKKLGMDLVEEVKEKGREMRAWTAQKLPHLHRRNSSGSEISDSSTDEGERMENLRNSFHRWHRLKFGNKNRMGSCSSLAQAHSIVTMEDTTSIHLWVGKDYVNWISKDLDNLDEPFKDIVDRHQTPRMPWHDIGLFVEGPAARDAARHFIQRWNAVKTEKAKQSNTYPYLLPRTYDREYFLSSNLQPKHRVKCQVVRSVGNWSAGLDEDERSIYSAYVDLIRGAKHYIYIENQFFITNGGNIDGQRDIRNFIGHEIVERIVQAHNNGEVFRVFIMLPLLPAFEGMIGKSSGIAMQYIVYWNYVSISRGKSSVIQCLKERGVTEWERYVSFCSLRTHENLGDHPVSELIYIHSKLMIVDDRFVIAGSANINDRSLNGDRDSEVCLVIEDQEFENSIMNGKPYKAGVFAGSMREYLFNEHLGVADSETPLIDVCDPVSDAFFINTWHYIANKNTLIYEEVFSCYPCNSATTFEAVDKLRKTTTLAEVNPAEAQAKLKEIQGHLVLFPLDFLKDETLKPGVGNKEYLLPMYTWT